MIPDNNLFNKPLSSEAFVKSPIFDQVQNKSKVVKKVIDTIEQNKKKWFSELFEGSSPPTGGRMKKITLHTETTEATTIEIQVMITEGGDMKLLRNTNTSEGEKDSDKGTTTKEELSIYDPGKHVDSEEPVGSKEPIDLKRNTMSDNNFFNKPLSREEFVKSPIFNQVLNRDKVAEKVFDTIERDKKMWLSELGKEPSPVAGTVNGKKTVLHVEDKTEPGRRGPKKVTTKIRAMITSDGDMILLRSTRSPGDTHDSRGTTKKTQKGLLIYDHGEPTNKAVAYQSMNNPNDKRLQDNIRQELETVPKIRGLRGKGISGLPETREAISYSSTGAPQKTALIGAFYAQFNDVVEPQTCSLKQRVGIFLDLAETLIGLHKEGLSHNDFKEDNIMFDTSLGIENAKPILIDYDTATNEGEKVTRATRELRPIGEKGDELPLIGKYTDLYAFAIVLEKELGLIDMDEYTLRDFPNHLLVYELVQDLKDSYPLTEEDAKDMSGKSPFEEIVDVRQRLQDIFDKWQ